MLLSKGFILISFRALKLGYELALHNPDCWQSLIELKKPVPSAEPIDLVSSLHQKGSKVAFQVSEFIARTGLSRRTFFTYRRHLGFSK